MSGALHSVLQPAGADAAIISQFAWVLFGAGTVIFVAVMALVALSLRDNAGALRPGLWIAGAGVALPVLVLSALLAWSTWRSYAAADVVM
jgi:cytochrome c oxidase subunit 2